MTDDLLQQRLRDIGSSAETYKDMPASIEPEHEGLWNQFLKLSYPKSIIYKPTSGLIKAYHLGSSFISVLQKLGHTAFSNYDLNAINLPLLEHRLDKYVNTIKGDVRLFGFDDPLLKPVESDFRANAIAKDQSINAGLGFTVEGHIVLESSVELDTVIKNMRNKLYANRVPVLFEPNNRTVSQQKKTDKMFWFHLRARDDYEIKATRCSDKILLRYTIRIPGAYYYGNKESRLDDLADVWASLFILNN